MRDIKFRVWDSSRNQILESDDGRGFYFEMSPIGGNGIRDMKGNDLEGEFSGWMQFTGLTDINGKEIYEGDVVSSKSYHDKKWIITWTTDSEYCGFVPKEVGTDNISFFVSWGNMEVIGNVYENSNLIKK